MSNRGKSVIIDGVAYPSHTAAAEALGISPQAVWLRANPDYAQEACRRWPYVDHVLSDQPGNVSRRLTSEELDAIVSDLRTLSVREIARKHGISTSTVNYYRKKYRE